MDNVYGQESALERNSIVELPEGYAENAGNTLYSWLGSLWRSLNRGDPMVRGLQKARGIRLAQLYLDLLEAARLQDRFGAPVFHRELWHPIVIRLSERDTAQENMLSVGMDAVVGPQPPGSLYGEGTVLEMGRKANYQDYVTYPIGKNIVGMSAQIVDNIINPQVAMLPGDFEFRNNSIIFPKENDPLAPGSPFEKYDVPGADPDDPRVSDMETVLWASDVLMDKDYLAEHLSYPLGATAPSTDVVKRILNAAWSSIASGLTPELLRTFMAAMLNIPVIQSETETVVNIVSAEDVQTVYTDKGVYRVSPKARLVEGLHSGSVMHRGDLLDESLRIYPFLNGKDPDGMDLFSVPLRQDIPSVTVPSGLLRARTEYGVYAMWGESEVKRSKSSPGTDENPHLYFDVGGTPEDVAAFWEDAWKRADAKGASMADIVGEEGTKVSPAEFFLKHFTGANTLFAVVDGSQLDDPSLMHDPMFFGMLSSVVPSAIRLFLVEHRPVVEDAMDLGSQQDDAVLYAALPGVVEDVFERPLPGLAGRGPSFGDHVEMRFVRPAPAKVRGKKEEEA